jgi:RHS repeat-associated protein
MLMPGRKYPAAGGLYRYGFNGKENENGTGEGNLDFGARIYDSKLGRWLGVDKYADKYPNISPYAFCANSPLQFKDANGNWLVDKNGNIIYTMGVASYEQNGNEIYQVATYYFYTNDGQAVEVGRYMLKSTLDNVE